jgi:polyphosphate kinase 2 (PPK2 family)
MTLKNEQARLNRNLENLAHRGICVVLEGRDTAGKSSTIREVTHFLNPAKYSIHLSRKPSRSVLGILAQWFNASTVGAQKLNTRIF